MSDQKSYNPQKNQQKTIKGSQQPISSGHVISYESHVEKRFNEQVVRSTILRASKLKW